MYQFITTRNGYSAKKIQRDLGYNYKTCWRMGHQIRKLMGGGMDVPLSSIKGIVEIDETYIGGKASNMHGKRRRKFKGTGNFNKITVFGIYERGVGIRAQVIPKNYVTGKDLKPLIREKIDKGATIITDGHGAYFGLGNEYKHEIVNHEAREYVRGENIHTNSIEGFWSQVKRTIGGTHIQVKAKYLPLYVNECAFRYNNVFKGEKMFDTVLANLPIVRDEIKRQ